jgi:hypothetical protein
MSVPGCTIVSVVDPKSITMQNAETFRWGMSLGGVLLRLMMAGLVHLCVGPTPFFVSFAITEVIHLASRIAKKGAAMTKDAVVKMFKSHKRPIIDLWNVRPPLSREPLPMSL